MTLALQRAESSSSDTDEPDDSVGKMLGLRLVDTQSLMRIIQGRLGMLKGSGNEDVCILYFG